VNQKIYEHLKQVAKNGDIVSYGTIASMLGLDTNNQADRNKLSEVLGDISRHEDSLGHPLLSAVVTFKDIPYPGDGFFEMARECQNKNNRYEGHTNMDELEFFTQQLKRVHELWKNG
jgi:hypothetical protein